MYVFVASYETVFFEVGSIQNNISSSKFQFAFVTEKAEYGNKMDLALLGCFFTKSSGVTIFGQF
jgi:hypothetical protein